MMTNLVLFLNSFLSYLLVVVVFVIVMGIAIYIGYILRKHKDAEGKTKDLKVSETKDRGAEQ